MGVASYKTVVRKGGTVTVMTSEAMTTNSTVANTFRITDGTKRVWARTVALTFRTAGTTVSSTAVTSTDKLFGTVVFNSSAVAAPITVAGSYIPLAIVAGGNSYSINQSAEMLDDTDFSSTNYRTRAVGLKDVSVAIGKFDSLESDFFPLINSGNSVVIDIQPGGVGSIGRGWFLVESQGRAGDVGGLEAADLSFQLDEDPNAAFKWGSS